MEAVKLTNIALDIFCCLIDIVILLCMLTVNFKRDKMNRMFILFVMCNLLTLIMDIGISLWDANGDRAVYHLLQISHFVTFALGPVLLLAFTYYIFFFLSGKTTLSRAAKYCTWAAAAVCAADFVMCLLNPLTRAYFYMDAANVYHRQHLFWLSQAFSFVCIAINTGVIIAYRKAVTKSELLFLLSYTALPAAALAAHVVLYGFSIINFAITFMILLFYVGIQSEQSNKLKQKELELANARIDIMLSQIKPHFLYNTLATIEGMVLKDPYKTKDMLGNFAAYLRENMNTLTQKELIPFTRELRHLNTYLEFEKERFKERLTVEYKLETEDFYLPILTVQPIVENAVRHGVTKKRGGGTVCIESKRAAGGVEIIVSDDGKGFDCSAAPAGRSGHVGIENVRGRLKSQCGGSLTVESQEGRGTKCTIFIPGERKV